VTVRPARPDDIVTCSHVNGDYQTNYVWQMHFQEQKHRVQVVFNQVRLPRSMAAHYPFQQPDLLASFEQESHLWVACYDGQVVGCLGGAGDDLRGVFAINNLIVDQAARRNGIGKRLLQTIHIIAGQQGCQSLTIALQTKNDPAIRFAQKMGFVFCGYDDKYFPNGDIALIFSMKI
jgi:ribosomal protein S18 acetylase RimI-like enzyme